MTRPPASRNGDIACSLIEVLLMSVVIMSVHCYYGYRATGTLHLSR